MGEYKVDRRVCVYPAYLSSTLTVAEGRRIPAALATENPSAHEVYESAMRLGFKCALESKAEAAEAAEAEAAAAAAAQDKSYPRDYMVRGRIRIELKNEDGTPANANITTKRALLIELAKMVPTTMARKKRGEAGPIAPIGEPIVQKLMTPKEERQAEKEKAKSKSGKKKK